MLFAWRPRPSGQKPDDRCCGVKIVVLCGGKGTRLGLGNTPKAMVPMAGVPLLERIVRLATEQGFSNFLFLSGHGAGAIFDHFGDGERFGATIEHLVETEPLGTAGSFRAAQDRLVEPFLVIYGDVMLDVDLAAFAGSGRANGGAGTLFVHPNDHPEDSDLVSVDEAGRILAFHAKPHPPGSRLPNLVSAAIYYLDPVVLDGIPEHGMFDWGRDIFPALCTRRPIFAYRSCEYAKDIGTPSRLQRAEGHLREGRISRLSRRWPKPVVFVDRDGVINEERGGVLSTEDVQLLPGAAMAIRALNDAGIPVICATNQPFVAKGQLDWAGLRAIGGEIDCQLAAASGAFLDDVRICPHHPETGWPGEISSLKVVCECRKPGSGLLTDAAQFHNIDLTRSWMIGDRYGDIAAGRGAGTHTALVRTGVGGSDREKFTVEADLVAPDLLSAVNIILANGL